MPRPEFQVGLVGAGIQASRSPAMHMDEAKALGVLLEYRLIDLDQRPDGARELEQILADCEHEGFAGVNITHPCKQQVLDLLDELSPDARALGAVNTVVFNGGHRVGYNTDWWGFSESFRSALPDAKLNAVLLLGAGGAGSAVAYAMLRMGVEQLLVFDVEVAKAKQLIARLSKSFAAERMEAAPDANTAIAQCNGVINATPIGMSQYPGLPLPAALLRQSLWVAEIVYFPLETELLRTARAMQCRTLDGGGMAVFQAAEAFRLFTGLKPDTRRMLDRFRAAA